MPRTFYAQFRGEAAARHINSAGLDHLVDVKAVIDEGDANEHYIGLVECPHGFKRVVFFDRNGQLAHRREGGAFETYVDPWIDRIKPATEAKHA